MAYEVKLETFSGPLHLLLELIEKEDLEITDVALAQVTDAYLKHVDQTDVPSSEMADFLLVAAKLIYLKSRAIMPQMDMEDEDGAETLASQLRLYQAFVHAAELIEKRFASNAGSIGRPKQRMKEQAEAVFSAPESVTPAALGTSFRRLLKRLQPFFALRQTSIQKVVSVEQRIQDIQKAVLSRAKMTFREITSGASKLDVVVSFMALLELVKQRSVHVVQSQSFGEIQLKRVD